MSPLKHWNISRIVRPLASAAAVICICVPSLLAQPTAPQVQFLTTRADAPGVYGPPGRPGPGETLGVRILGLPARVDVQLRIYGLVNPSVDRAPEHNRTVLVAALGSAEIGKQSTAKDPADVFVPLPTRATKDALELTASLAGSSGAQIGLAKVTLDQSASMQQSPSLLQKAVAAGSTLLDRLMNVYDSVRAAPEARSIFLVSLEQGKPVSAPVALPVDRAQFRGLALSPHGRLLAWIVAKPGQYELWASPVEAIAPIKIASSAQAILTPFFAGEENLLYVTGAEMMIAPVDGKQASRSIETPFRALSEIDFAWQTPHGIASIVAAEHPDAPGLSCPYMLSFSATSGKSTASPLASNPYYRSYPLLVDGAPYFFAGWQDGKEGIHYFQPDAPGAGVSSLFRVHSPGLIAIAANGSRLAFAGRP